MGDDLNSRPSALVAFIVYFPNSVAESSAHSKCGIERLKQGRIAEWFEQALNRTLFEQAWTHGLVCMSGDEHDWNLLPATRQFPLEIGSGHARHGDVKDQASGLGDAIGCQEFFCRGERLNREAELPQQVR
jgi:hypothetical protein